MMKVGKERFRLANVRCSYCGRRIETAEEASDSRESGSDKGFVEAFGSDLMRIGVSLEIVVRLFFYIVRIVSD